MKAPQAATYQAKADAHDAALQAVNKQQSLISAGRVLLMVGMIYFGYRYFSGFSLPWLWPLLGSLLGFVVLIRFYFKNQRRADLLSTLVRINKEELAYVEQRELSAFADGIDYLDPEHPYSFDLDVFGPESLYQHFNRCGTQAGRDRLAATFTEQDTAAILPRQEAVKELANAIDWRQDFYARGMLNSPAGSSEAEAFDDWLQAPAVYLKKHLLRVMMFLLPILTGFSLLAIFLGFGAVATSSFTILFLVNLGLIGFHTQRFKKEFAALEGISRLLLTYGQLLECVEKASFEAPSLQALRQRVFTDQVSASAAIRKLARVLSKFEAQNNPVVSIFANGLFLDALHTLIALERWKQRYGAHIPDWVAVIAEYDSLSSLGNFTYNNDDFCWPEISETPRFDLADAAHPLIPADKRIANTLSFSPQRFVVLTGSNMSGKSTFLRTLGVNLLLCRMGAPLCASQAHVYPMDLFVSMKINDSLQSSESLFYAELKRLHRITEQVKTGKVTFVILDEILRGTNSNDKNKGTRSLIEQLAAYPSFGIIATHDLDIATMQESHPDFLSNQCFEVEIAGDAISFDYTLKPGVCQKMSAVFLMRQMEIIKS